jgi:hypothetical protein
MRFRHLTQLGGKYSARHRNLYFLLLMDSLCTVNDYCGNAPIRP